jgi:hypothetical protein
MRQIARKLAHCAMLLLAVIIPSYDYHYYYYRSLQPTAVK